MSKIIEIYKETKKTVSNRIIKELTSSFIEYFSTNISKSLGSNDLEVIGTNCKMIISNTSIEAIEYNCLLFIFSNIDFIQKITDEEISKAQKETNTDLNLIYDLAFNFPEEAKELEEFIAVSYKYFTTMSMFIEFDEIIRTISHNILNYVIGMVSNSARSAAKTRYIEIINNKLEKLRAYVDDDNKIQSRLTKIFMQSLLFMNKNTNSFINVMVKEENNLNIVYSVNNLFVFYFNLYLFSTHSAEATVNAEHYPELPDIVVMELQLRNRKLFVNTNHAKLVGGLIIDHEPSIVKLKGVFDTINSIFSILSLSYIEKNDYSELDSAMQMFDYFLNTVDNDCAKLFKVH